MTDNGKQYDDDTAHFGYRNVPKGDKEGLVADVFHSVANKYDVMNDLMSMGMHRLWKRLTIEASAVRSGHVVMDVAGGTGDLAQRFSHMVGPDGRVVLTDINESMLRVGRDRMIDNGILGNVDFVQANAEFLPFPDNTFDCITISFGLRNVTNKEAALASMYLTLKPGGKLLVLEFSKTKNPLLTKIYDIYSFSLLPMMGKWVADDYESYQYLAESIRMHPDQETLELMMQEAGFVNTTWHNMTGGIVALHKGIKP